MWSWRQTVEVGIGCGFGRRGGGGRHAVRCGVGKGTDQELDAAFIERVLGEVEKLQGRGLSSREVS